MTKRTVKEKKEFKEEFTGLTSLIEALELIRSDGLKEYFMVNESGGKFEEEALEEIFFSYVWKADVLDILKAEYAKQVDQALKDYMGG